MAAPAPLGRLPAAPPPIGPMRTGPVMLMPRRIPGGVAATLDELPEEMLPRLRFTGTAPALRPRLRAAVAERLARPRWLAGWLLDDVLDQVALLLDLAGPAPIRVALDVGGDGHGTPFEAAAGRLRLVTHYRGPGAEWLAPRVPDAPRLLPRGDVAIFRGEASPEGAGVLHRARAEAGSASLRLTVDALEPVRPTPKRSCDMSP